jgi:predicted Ser/Thr protein kinase
MNKKQRVESPLIWFQLVDDNTGEPYKRTTCSSIVRSSLVIVQFRDAVKAKHSNKLASIPASTLLVYKNRSCFDKRSDTQSTSEPLEASHLIGRLGATEDSALIVVVPSLRILGIDDFLSNTLRDIEKVLSDPATTGTQTRYPRKPGKVGRWERFKAEAAGYDYPTTPIAGDVILPGTRAIRFRSESDVSRVIGSHFDNFNRIFADQGLQLQFQSKPDVFPFNPETSTPPPNVQIIGAPDNVLTLDSRVLSFVENTTPNDLPVRDRVDGKPLDLLEMYKEDREYEKSKTVRKGNGRSDVCALINQVYGYLSLSNLMYGCVTCYDVTYFLWRPARSTLLISHPIFNDSQSPTLLQTIYYFSQLVCRDHMNQNLHPCPEGISFREEIASKDRMDPDEHYDTHIESESDCSTTEKDTVANPRKRKRKYHLDLDSVRSGVVIGEGATGQVIRLRDSNIVVKHCDSYNNPDGFEMLKNEISIYERLSPLNLRYIPHYYGECEYYGQHFIALEYIPGPHCDWKSNIEWKKKLQKVVRDLKSIGVIHQDLRPENVILTPNAEIKLIDFGNAKMKELRVTGND